MSNFGVNCNIATFYTLQCSNMGKSHRNRKPKDDVFISSSILSE